MTYHSDHYTNPHYFFRFLIVFQWILWNQQHAKDVLDVESYTYKIKSTCLFLDASANTRKLGQEVITIFLDKACKPAKNSILVSTRMVHLLIRDAANIVYSVIPIVNLPVLSITATGFHHCSSCGVMLHSRPQTRYVTPKLYYTQSELQKQSDTLPNTQNSNYHGDL